MDKKEAIEEFLKSLKVALNSSSVYFKEHPMVTKAIEDLKEKISNLFRFIQPIKIIISRSGLFIEEKLADLRLYRDLAEILHLRKIKSIEFRDNVSFGELLSFITKLSLPIKEIFKEGGLLGLLHNDNIRNIFVEELDYSELLTVEGEECKDIWVFLLQDVVEKKNLERINLLVENFPKILNKFKDKDFLEDESLKESILKFLSYLKDTENNKFFTCSKELFRIINVNKDIKESNKFDRLIDFLKYLSTSQLAQLLWDEVFTNDNFDGRSLSLFLHLVEPNIGKEVVSSFIDKVKKESVSIDLKTRKKIIDLFLKSDSNILKEPTYDFSPLLKLISLEKGLLDYKPPLKNYHMILLYLLSETKKIAVIKRIINNLLDIWEEIVHQEDINFFKDLFKIIEMKKRENLFIEDIFKQLLYKLNNFMENKAIEEDSFFEEIFKITFFKNTYDFKFYLDTIFKQNKITPNILALCFKTADFNLAIFLKYLKIKKLDIKFIIKFIDNIKKLNISETIEILKYIYSFSNVFVKIKITEAMQSLSIYDERFLFNILKSPNVNIRKNALAILVRDDKLRKKSIETFLYIFNPFGIRNRLLLENLSIIEELSLKDAKIYLEDLIKKSFWNKKVKIKATSLIKKLEN